MIRQLCKRRSLVSASATKSTGTTSTRQSGRPGNVRHQPRTYSFSGQYITLNDSVLPLRLSPTTTDGRWIAAGKPRSMAARTLVSLWHFDHS